MQMGGLGTGLEQCLEAGGSAFADGLQELQRLVLTVKVEMPGKEEKQISSLNGYVNNDAI
jgi:hypothetical protein